MTVTVISRNTYGVRARHPETQHHVQRKGFSTLADAAAFGLAYDRQGYAVQVICYQPYNEYFRESGTGVRRSEWLAAAPAEQEVQSA